MKADLLALAERVEDGGHLDCKACGACCIEAGPVAVYPSDAVPRYLTQSVRNRMGFASYEAGEGTRCMKSHLGGRCVALRGVIGEATHCAIYGRRPAVCRRFEPGSEECIESRKMMAYRQSRNDWKPRGYGPRPLDGDWP